MDNRAVVRQRLVLTSALALWLIPACEGRAAVADKTPEPIDRRPYRILAHVVVEPEARIDDKARAALIDDWKALAARLVGAPWVLTVNHQAEPNLRRPLEAIEPSAFDGTSLETDKVWVIRVAQDGSGYVLSGREYDVTTKRIGPIHRMPVPFAADAPRRLLRLSLELFAPLAEVGEQSGGGVTITVRGASLLTASPEGRLVSVGSVFQPLRIVTLRDGKQRILGIPFTYLRVESLDGAVARCAIVSALRDPFTGRIVQKSSFLALGIKPASAPTRLRFVTRANKIPAAGYLLTARAFPDGAPREVGTTDREGRISIPPGFADGLVILRLLAGNIEPMVELPAMPGESDAERTIPFEPRPQTVALEAHLDSLRDRVVDLVAIRARLEARLKARYEGEDWPGVEATLKEFFQLTPRDEIAAELTKLKDAAAHQQAASKTAVLTRTAQAQIAEIQALIDRYLDDEVVRAYQEGLEKAKSGEGAKPKAP